MSDKLRSQSRVFDLLLYRDNDTIAILWFLMWNDTLTLKFSAKIKDSFITHEIVVQITIVQ